MSNNTTKEQFLLEYEALRTARKSNHPNLIQVLQAFRHVEGGVQSFNFLFPLASGNLKHLFRGSLDNTEIARRAQDLWGQIEGLASAVEYLHDECRIAHRDIKPSNILLYDESEYPYLQAKITDFGLAISLDGATTFNPDTKEAKSALQYDAPEIRKYAEELGLSHSKRPRPQDLTKGDVWKFGTVFTELLTFLLLGSRGVEDFRDFITTTEGNIRSDMMEGAHFDDGTEVKPEVLRWLNKLAQLSTRDFEITRIFVRMLGEVHSRPDMRSVVRYSREVGLLFTSC
jgi:serine/threonine protein kinase